MSNIMLENLYIHNFKSFYKSKFEFGKVNCIIAPNNTGKSNLIDVLKLLDSLIYRDTHRTVKVITSISNMKNYHYDDNEAKLNAKFKIKNRVLVGDELIDYDITLLFLFSLNYKSNYGFTDVIIDGKIKSTIIDKNDLKKGLGLRKFENLHLYIDNINLYLQKLNKNNYRTFHFDYNGATYKYSISNMRFINTENIVQKLLGLNISKNNEELLDALDFKSIFNRTTLFSSHYFHAHDMKKKNDIGYDYLLENGINIAEYLESLDKETFENISLSLIGEVELVNAIELEKGAVTKLVFKEEVNNKINDVEIQNISDGTIHFIAIITAIIGNQDSIGVMIEEPERHMHMKVLSTILSTMRDDDKQMFFTTHSTEILQQLKLDEIVFMFRDYNGDTKGQRAKGIPNIKKIMKLFKSDLVEMIQTGVLGEYDE